MIFPDHKPMYMKMFALSQGILIYVKGLSFLGVNSDIFLPQLQIYSLRELYISILESNEKFILIVK